ncbi:MAG: hypothetical protein IK004_06780 [Bacteroidales bacterium]|nr:hypothetical protein [Bacteroidales bacterium]
MFWKILSVVLLSVVKTFYAPAAGFAAGLSFGVTFAATSLGAIAGFTVFYFFCDIILNRFYKKRKSHPSEKQLKKARKIVIFKKKYPVWLFLPMLTIMSVPVMAIIVRKFFNHNKPMFALSLLTVTLFALVGCLVFSPIQML